MALHTKAGRKSARRRNDRAVMEWNWFVMQCLASGSSRVRELGQRLRHAPVGTVWFSGTPERTEIRVTHRDGITDTP